MSAQAGTAAARLTARGAQVRQRIVEAAAGLIFERGVASTTMEDVKAAAAVSSSQLYHYFQDKQALVRAVVAHQTDTMVTSQELARPDSLDGFRAWRDHLIHFARQNQCRGGCPLGSLGSELAESDAQGRADVAAGMDRLHDTIRDGLQAMQDHGQLTAAADPDALALAALAAFQGGLLLTQIHRDIAPLQAALDTLLTHLELLTPPPPEAASSASSQRAS